MIAEVWYFLQGLQPYFTPSSVHAAIVHTLGNQFCFPKYLEVTCGMSLIELQFNEKTVVRSVDFI